MVSRKRRLFSSSTADGLSPQQLGVARGMAQRRAQIVRHRVGEGFQLLVRRFKIVARVEKIAFGAPPHGGEDRDGQRQGHENEIIRNLVDGDVEGVERLDKEIVEGYRRQDDRQGSRSAARVPGDDRNRQGQQRQPHVAEAVDVCDDRQSQRNGDGHERKAVAQDRRRAQSLFQLIQIWVHHRSPRSGCPRVLQTKTDQSPRACS